MNFNATLIGTLVSTVLATYSSGAAAGTEMEKALSNGGEQLTADEIAERFVGSTGKWRPAGSEDKQFLIHYGAGNALSGTQVVGGDWSDSGYYGITNADSICVSWVKSDKERLRCFNVLVVDGVVKKYRPDGSLAGDMEKFEDGKTF